VTCFESFHITKMGRIVHCILGHCYHFNCWRVPGPFEVNIQADDIVIRGVAEAGILTGTSAFLTFPCSPMRGNFGQIRAVELPNWIGIALGCHFSSPNHLAECSYMELIRWALSPTLGAIEPYMQVGRTVQFRDGSRKIYSKRFFGRPER
jgi:hypothetical protein